MSKKQTCKELISKTKGLLEEVKKGGETGISALKRLEEALNDIEKKGADVAANEERRAGESGMLLSIIDASSDFIAMADPRGNVLYINRGGRRMLDIGDDEDLRGMRIPDTHTLWATELVVKEGLPTALEKGTWAGETAFISKKGRVIPASQLIMAHKDSKGEVLFYSTIARDITQQKRSEAALRQSEERFRQIFEQSDYPKLLLSFDGLSVMDLNPAAVSLFGYSLEEFSEFGPAVLFGSAAMAKEMALELKTGGSFGTGSIETRKKDGRKVVISLRGQKVGLKEWDFVYCTVKDMTDTAALEEETRAMQAKLVHANKMTSIGTLASGVAHEINNPNNFILFNSTLLSDTWADAIKVLESYYNEHGDYSIGGLPFLEMKEVIPDLLFGITDGARRIKGIVEGLKDFSRGPSAMEVQVDVNGAVAAAVFILDNQIRKHTDNFMLKSADGLPPVKGSSQKIEQVIINLIMNALHALTDRNGAVRVETFPAGGGGVAIKVEDTGVGMTKDVLERITEPFFTTKASSGGTGLGLSISYSIIKEHGGTIEFDSNPGRGTAVTVWLPADHRAKQH